MPIPDVSGYRPPDSKRAIEEWKEGIRDEIGVEIEKHAHLLRNGDVLSYSPKVYRDGTTDRLWVEHYNVFVDELRENGWTVSVHFTFNTARLQISSALPK